MRPSRAAPAALLTLFLQVEGSPAQQNPAQQNPGQQTQQQSFGFLRTDTLRIDWRQLNEAARIPVALRNQGTASVSLTLRLNDDEPGGITHWITLAPGTLTLGPAGVAHASVAARVLSRREVDSLVSGRSGPLDPQGPAAPAIRGWPAGKHYYGELVAYAAGSGAVARRPVHLSVVGGVPRPAVSSWALTAYRNPITGGLSPPGSGWFLPIDPFPQTVLNPAAGAPLGGLAHRENDRITDLATVWWTGRTDSVRGRTAGLQLGIRGAEEVGTYRGEVYLDPDRRAGAVATTLVVTHSWRWAALALVAGVALAMWLQFYVGVRRGQWQLRERAARLAERFEEAREEVKNLLPADLHSDYDVADDFQARLAEVQEEISRTGAPPFVAPRDGDPTFTSVTDRLSSLEAQVRAWRDAAWHAKELHADLARRTAASYGEPPYGSDLSEPRLFSAAAELLHAGVRQDAGSAALARAVPAAERLASFRAAIGEWDRLGRTVDDALGRLAKITRELNDHGTTAEEPRKALSKAADLIFQARTKLWDSLDPDDLKSSDPKTDLQNAALELAGLEEHLPAPAFAESIMFAFPPSHRHVLAGSPPPPAAAGPSLFRRVRSARYWRLLIRGWDWGFVLLSVVVAVLTGLAELYFDEPVFGTPLHYVQAVLWGFGARTGLEVLRAGIGRLGLRFPGGG
jgi:hypothetical protein